MKKNKSAVKCEAQKELEELKKDFLNSITHDFKTPITAILGYANLILDSKKLDPENLECLDIIIKSAKKLDKMIGSILNNRLQSLKKRRQFIEYL